MLTRVTNVTKILVSILVGQFISAQADVMVPAPGQQLNWVDVVPRTLSTQVMFDFAQPITCTRTVDQQSNQLTLTFPELSAQAYNNSMVTEKLQALKTAGIADAINVNDLPDKGVAITITFATHRYVIDPQTNATHKLANQFLVKWCTLERRVICDIFTDEALKNVASKTQDFIKLAANDVQLYDYPAYGPLGHTPRKQLRVMIDPGHGGTDTGAASCLGNLLEKEVTLDVGRQVYALLKKKGHRAFLTRSEDVTVPLSQRAELAAQLKADLFVSIHANSSGIPNSKGNGIETYYYHGREILNKKNVEFMFVNRHKDIDMVNTLHHNMCRMFNVANNLATSVHQSVMASLKKSDLVTTDRGVKSDSFRTFVHNHIPATLVEIGFLTNRDEAARLAQASYRKTIAHGIVNGICSFIAAQG